MRLDISDIALQDLMVSESIDAAGNSRLAQAFAPASTDEDTQSTTTPAAVTPAADPASKPFSLRLGQLALHNAGIAAADLFAIDAAIAFHFHAAGFLINLRHFGSADNRIADKGGAAEAQVQFHKHGPRPR